MVVSRRPARAPASGRHIAPMKGPPSAFPQVTGLKMLVGHGGRASNNERCGGSQWPQPRSWRIHPVSTINTKTTMRIHAAMAMGPRPLAVRPSAPANRASWRTHVGRFGSMFESGSPRLWLTGPPSRAPQVDLVEHTIRGLGNLAETPSVAGGPWWTRFERSSPYWCQYWATSGTPSAVRRGSGRNLSAQCAAVSSAASADRGPLFGAPRVLTGFHLPELRHMSAVMGDGSHPQKVR